MRQLICLPARRGDAAKDIPVRVQRHGPALTGVSPNTPGLLGLSRDDLNWQPGAWTTGQRQAHAPDCMAQIARLAPGDLFTAASWLAAEPLPAQATAAAPSRPAKRHEP